MKKGKMGELKGNIATVIPENGFRNPDELIVEDIHDELRKTIHELVQKYKRMGIQISIPAVLLAMCAISAEQLYITWHIDPEDETVAKIQKELSETAQKRSRNDFQKELMGCYNHIGAINAIWLSELRKEELEEMKL